MTDLPVIRRAPGVGKGRAPCEHSVHTMSGLRSRLTLTALIRVEKAERAGRPISQCARPSHFLVDGVPMCQGHAGLAALNALVGENR